MKYDVIVVGGGLTGVAASLAAARAGRRVLLLEETNALGGSASRCLVNPFMPYFTPIHPAKGEERRMLSGGLFAEICDRLAALTAEVHGRDFRYVRKPYNTFSEEYLKLVLNRMVTEAGIEVLFHTTVIDVKRIGHAIRSLSVFHISDKEDLEADQFIDCTGDADVAVLAGFPYHLGRESDHLCQPMTLCFRVGDVDVARFNADKQRMQTLYKQFRQEGKIKNIREDVLVFPTISDNVLHFNTTRIVKLDPTDVRDVSRAEKEAREQVWEMFTFLRDHIDGCQNAQLLSTAMQIGVRESRMIDGEYTLTQEDLISCRKFDDGIAACNYDIDIHNPEGTGTSHWYFPAHEYYTIPYRCLIPRGSDNLLVAGRCISSTHEAQASYRIMPVVCTLGQAAGEAAALAFESGVSVRDISVEELRARLLTNGCIL